MTKNTILEATAGVCQRGGTALDPLFVLFFIAHVSGVQSAVNDASQQLLDGLP